MTLYAPKYYKDFKCTADKCSHSCCIGWEIDIDPDTQNKYNELTDGYGNVIKNSISSEGAPHFTLGECDRCPHLNERGLCNIILNVGEDYLCDICREHPRFYNFTSIAEVGIGMSCEEAARIILTSPDYSTMERVGDVDAKPDSIEFDGIAERGNIYSVLRDTALPYGEKLGVICEKYSISLPDVPTYLDILDSLEYLDDSHHALFMTLSDTRPEDADTYLERFLAYFIYRHCTEAIDPADLCDRLTFCLFCEQLFASLIVSTGASTLDELITLARIISEEIEYSDDNTCALTYI